MTLESLSLSLSMPRWLIIWSALSDVRHMMSMVASSSSVSSFSKRFLRMVTALWSYRSLYVFGAVWYERILQHVSLSFCTRRMASMYGFTFRMAWSIARLSICLFSRYIFASVTG